MQGDTKPEVARKNRRMGVIAFGIAIAMVGASFAAVPLYRVFCQATGFNGTPVINSADSPGVRAGTIVTVRFNANTNPGLDWDFSPEQREVKLPLGEEAMAFYTARNRASTPVEGVAVYNVTPEVVGPYFHKTACFCFDSQTLAAGQQVEMPVTFWVDPKIADDPNTSGIRTITLSYTFYRTLADAQRAGALAHAGPHVGRLGSATR